MVSRLMQMVSFILSRTFEGDEEDWGDARQRIGELLETHGYDPAEISVALDVALRIRQRLSGDEEITVPIHTNQVFTYLEHFRLTTEARGYLIRLLHEKAITPVQYHQVIEKSLLFDIPDVGREEVELILCEILDEDADSEEFPDTRRSLH